MRSIVTFPLNHLKGGKINEYTSCMVAHCLSRIITSCSIVKVCCDYIRTTSLIREQVESGARTPFAYQERGVPACTATSGEILFWKTALG